MIFIDRARTDATGKPIQPKSTWMAKAAAKSTEAIADGRAHVVSDLYRDTAVKVALEELFHSKCAYCETRLGVGTDWDVEHYRPKGNVAERADHPGYYWLAYTWANLYPACQYCNQRRKDAPSWTDPTTGAAMGKLDQFPLADETHRAMDPTAPLTAEDPLLIAADEPGAGSHFRFDPLGRIQPKESGDARAEATMRICHLERKRLVRERKRAIVRMVELLKVEAAMAVLPAGTAAHAALSEVLQSVRGDDAEHAAAARAVEDDPAAFGV